jgi:hypothetical protein
MKIRQPKGYAGSIPAARTNRRALPEAKKMR